MSETVDVVVVGAGLSGLTAASMLARSGREVRVLEADSEVGGRTRTRSLEGGVLTELGGEWIGPQHRHVLQLARSLGLHVLPAGQLGKPVLWRGARGDRVSRVPLLPPQEELALLRACWRLNRLGHAIDPVQPWLSPGAEALDEQTIAAWLRDQGVRGDGFAHLATVLGALLSADIEGVSLLHLLWWVARGRGVARILRTTFAYNLLEGAQSISQRLAAALGDSVTVGTPVQQISDNEGVEVLTTAGDRIIASDAVVTAPVGTLSRIDFSPRLPTALAALDELRGRPGTKISAMLPTGHRVRQRAAVGGSVLAAAWRVGRRITGFAPPGTAGAEDDVLLDELADLFGCRSDELTSATVHRWSTHAYIPGCDVGFAPGQLQQHGPQLVRAHGRVHFAGAERSSWPNNMEGAVESGTRVAREILTS